MSLCVFPCISSDATFETYKDEYQSNPRYLVGEIKTEYTDQKFHGMDNFKKSDLMLMLEQIVPSLAQSL
jgi:hypothetical protein